MSAESTMSRRQFLGGAVAGGASLALGGSVLGACSSGSSPAASSTSTSAARATTTTAPVIRQAGSLPFPNLAAGTESLPQIKHIVAVMMENHSFDNILGMLGRGDGFTLDDHGKPTAANPDGTGNLVHAFHMPTPCQLKAHPAQDWNDSHKQFNNGAMDGFVTSFSGPVSMGYWTGDDLPFTYAMASTFPIADRYFCSTLCQTDPNRRFLISGTAMGLVDDTFPSTVPPNGTIFTTLNKFNIPWKNYYSNLPTSFIYLPLISQTNVNGSAVKIDQFFSDAASGNLPGFSLVDPNFDTNSEENPQDILYGEQFLASIVNAVMSGPGWSSTLLVWCYDEHGGYFDHVAPPAAIPPDDVPPAITVPPDQPGGYDRYGFRVPAGVVCPYAKKNYVSHTVYDHTSILKLVETKWNLPALTRRDANADDLLDMVDLTAPPAFATPPTFPKPLDPATASTCLSTGTGTIPPPSAVSPA